MLLSQFSLTFLLKTQKEMQLLIALFMSIFVLTGTILGRYHLQDAPRDGIFKLGSSPAVTELCEWSQFESNSYIPHHKFHIKLESSA